MNSLPSAPEQHRAFKLIFVPLLIFSLAGQLAVVWTQLKDIRNGHFDFVLYYSGAKIVNDGNGSQLYDLRLQREYQRKFGARDEERDLPFNHLPYELLALLIPVKFSFPVAHALWAAINIFLLAVILVRLFPFLEAQHRPLFAMMLFAYFPTITALKMGQDSVITTFLLVETFVSLKRTRYAIAGGLLALGLYKPQFVLPMVGIFLLHRRWSLILGFLSTGLLLGAISLAMVGGDGLMGLFSLWLPMIQRGNVVWPELMTNLRGLVYMTLDLGGLSGATNILTFGLSVLLYIVTLRLWPRSADERSELFDLRFALAVVMTALVSFHLYSYDGTLLVISLIIMLNHVLNRPRPYPARHVVFLVILIVLFFPLVPNVLLGTAMLAWWALPLPVLFCVMTMEIRRHSAGETDKA
jgi:Glycosyltransferase family 87